MFILKIGNFYRGYQNEANSYKHESKFYLTYEILVRALFDGVNLFVESWMSYSYSFCFVFICSNTLQYCRHNVSPKYFVLMQPSMGTLNSPSSRVVKDSTPSRRRILRYINFGIGEFSPILFLDLMNLHLITFEARWILNQCAFYCVIIFFILKWILT